MISEKIEKTLSSEYLLAVLYGFAFLCQCFSLKMLCIFVMVAVVSAILLLAKDVRNIFGILLYAPFYIDDIYSNPSWVAYGICIGIVTLSLIYFVISRTVKGVKEKTVKKGEMIIPLIVAGVAFMLGGVAYNFNPTVTVVVFGFNVLTLLLYYIALNFTQNLAEHLIKTFVLGAFMVLLEMFLAPNGLSSYLDAENRFYWVGTENVNVAAIFLLLGVIGSFKLFEGEKHDCIGIVLAFILNGAIVILLSRIVMLCAVIADVVMFILCIKKSPNKLLYFGIACLLVITTAIVLLFGFSITDKIQDILGDKLDSFDGGRKRLWTWCFDRFKENKLLGIGFYIEGYIYGIGAGANDTAQHFVLAHNTVLQWLTSLGIIGCVLLIYFYYAKYKIICKGFSKTHLAIRISLIAIALTGIVDQAATMDTFIYLISIISLASLEKED